MCALKHHNHDGGYSLIELMIAAGWASVIMLAAFTGAYSIMHRNTETSLIINQNQFVSSLAQEITLPSKCTNNIKGDPLPAAVSATTAGVRLPLTLNNYLGYGSIPGTPVAASAAIPYTVPGTGGQIQLTEFSYERKAGSAPPETVGGVQVTRDILIFHIGTQIRNNVSGQWEQRPERTIEVLILAAINNPSDPLDDTVAICNGVESADAPIASCASIGGIINPVDKSCKLSENDFHGFYATTAPVGSPASISCKVRNTQTNACNCPPSNLNPAIDTFPYQSGAGEWSYSYFVPYACGKKGICNYLVTNYYVDTYYICVDNQKN